MNDSLRSQKSFNPLLITEDISGYEQALKDGDLSKIESILESLSIGNYIVYRDMLLYIDSPTAEELELLKESKQSGVEIGLLKSGIYTEKIYGSSMEISGVDIFSTAAQMKRHPDPKTFVHTHWLSTCNPLPSQSDLTIFNYLKSFDFESRIISWIPGKAFVFKGYLPPVPLES